MSKIAIIKVRGAQDVEFAPAAVIKGLSPILSLSAAGRRVNAVKGLTFMPSMALPYLAALGMKSDRANKKSHEYVLIDEPEKAFTGWDFNVDLVMFTVSTTNASGSYRVADMARMHGVPIIMGGIHPSMLPEEALTHADAVAVGEAETIMNRLLTDFDTNRLTGTYKGGRLESLENLPVPAWELGITPLVRGPGRTIRTGTPKPYAPWVVPVQTSRGCKNACRFCSTTRYQGAVRRHRPVTDIVKEIQELKDKGLLSPSQTVFFTDNNIVSDSDHRHGIRDTTYAKKLFRALEPLGITWVGQGEITVGEDSEMVELMARSGCHTLLIGMETLRQSELNGIGKPGMNAKHYADSLETLREHGISNIGCFIMGLDGHEIDAFQATAEFIREHVDIPQVCILTPLPGTALYYRMKADKRIMSTDWSLYDLSHVVIQPDRMNALDLETAYSDMISQIYSMKNIIKRAYSYAATKQLTGHILKSRPGRFSSIFAPNLVYRKLSLTDRGLPADTYAGTGIKSADGRLNTIHKKAFQAAS